MNVNSEISIENEIDEDGEVEFHINTECNAAGAYIDKEDALNIIEHFMKVFEL